MIRIPTGTVAVIVLQLPRHGPPSLNKIASAPPFAFVLLSVADQLPPAVGSSDGQLRRESFDKIKAPSAEKGEKATHGLPPSTTASTNFLN